MDVEDSSREGNAKFNFLGIIWESKRLLKSVLSGFQRAQNQKFGNHGATSGIYGVYYKSPVLSYSKVGTCEDPIPVDRYQNFSRYVSARDLSKNFDVR